MSFIDRTIKNGINKRKSLLFIQVNQWRAEPLSTVSYDVFRLEQYISQ
ncbi:hypothetical protein [Achromobacter ruhlandii]|nr:hypothetical protein [Achromobacter ruhlandii]